MGNRRRFVVGVARLLFAVTVLLSALPAAAQTLVFQPGFHQALRWSQAVSSTTTYRLKVPVGRAGNRIRLSFMAGDGALTIHRVTVARLDGQSVTTASFSGSPGVTLAARERVTSAPLAFPVAFEEEVFVSFEAQGHLATSAILAFPGSFAWAGNHAGTFPGPTGGAWYRAIGLSTVEVEGPARRAFVALGDSITEGYVEGDVWTYAARHDDYRDAWPTVMQARTRIPVANAAVSGQGLHDGLQYLDREVKSLSGITDCVVLLGTNDLPSSTGAQAIKDKLSTLFNRLNGFCRVWVSTLLPKDTSSHPNGATIVTQRHEVNGWIRGLTDVAGVIDLEAVTRDGSDADKFKAGYAADDVHPSVMGHAAMGAFAADFFASPVISSVTPAKGSTTGGTTVNLAGLGFRPGLKVRFGDAAAVTATVLNPTSARVVAPAHAAASVTITATNEDGSEAKVNDAFEFEAPGGTSGPTPAISTCVPFLLPATLGGEVTVTGAGFGPGTQVVVGGVQAEQVSVDSDSTLRFSISQGAPGAVVVQVVGAQGESVSSTTCLRFSAPPTLNRVTPSTVAAHAPTRVTLEGTGLADTAFVSIGTERLTPVSQTDTNIVVDLPAMPTGTWVAEVRANDGQQVQLADALTTVEGDVISSVDGDGTEDAAARAEGGCSATGSGLLGVLGLAGALRRRRR